MPSSFQQGLIPDDDEPPFGMLRIAAVAEAKGYIIRLLDAHNAGLTVQQIKEQLQAIKPKMIGLNPTSVNVPEAKQIAQIVNDLNIPFIIGGIHTTLDPQAALEHDFPKARAAVKGKGEMATLHILNDFGSGQKTRGSGVYYHNSDPRRDDYGDYYQLDDIPLIDYNRFVINPIIERAIKIGDKEIVLKEASLYVTSGCPFECTFCATPVMVGRGKGYKTYHRPKMAKIIESVKDAVDIGANAIHFIDDMAFVTPNHFREFYQGLEKTGLDYLYWRGMTRASIISDKCTEEDLKILADSNCWRVAMGVESGDPDILKRIKKRITLDQIRRAVSKLREAGIPQVKAFFIMGFPDETIEQIQATRDFIFELKGLGLTHMSLFQFKPYPGTEEWQRLADSNPEVLKQIFFVHVAGKTKNATVTHKLETDAALPDDLQIAQVPSNMVRDIVKETTEEFYA